MRKTEASSHNYFSLLPFITSSIQMCFLVASYLVGVVYSKNVPTYFPFPSDLGVKYHEKGLFDIGMMVGSTLGFSVVLLRYIQINGIYPRHFRGLNIFSMTIGIIMSCSQMLMVIYSNIKDVQVIHFIISRIYFLSVCFYIITQAQITRGLHNFHSKCVIVLRITCCVLAIIGAIAYVLGKLLTPESENWYRIPHASEWLIIICSILHFFTYCSDFNRVKFRSYIISGGNSYRNDSARGINYIDYLRNQNRTRKVSASHLTYYVNTKC